MRPPGNNPDNRMADNEYIGVPVNNGHLDFIKKVNRERDAFEMQHLGFEASRQKILREQQEKAMEKMQPLQPDAMRDKKQSKPESKTFFDPMQVVRNHVNSVSSANIMQSEQELRHQKFIDDLHRKENQSPQPDFVDGPDDSKKVIIDWSNVGCPPTPNNLPGYTPQYVPGYSPDVLESERRIRALMQAMADKLAQKNRGYGNSVFSPPILDPKIDPVTAIKVRLSDKFARLNQLLNGVLDEVGESIIDTADDIIGYSVLLRMAVENRIINMMDKKNGSTS